jgi:conjugal transfer mating pair stabilization protein TraG
MQAWDVITHGGGEGLYYTFNAVAAFFNGKTAGSSVGSLAATLGTISATFASALAIFMMVVKQDLKISFNWLFGSFLIMNLLMFPKVNILIIDRVTGFQRPVAHVPFMLGAFAGATSQLGDVMAKKMDDIFSGPIDVNQGISGKEIMNYRTHGVAMASQLIAKASRFTITDADMAANMREFVQQCVIIDIAKGKYSINEILESPDVWGLLKEHASPARGFPYRNIENRQIETKILTCQEGAAKLDIAWAKALDKSKKIYGARFYPHSKNPGHALISNMSISYGYLTNISAEASDILRQNMMINALEDGLLSANQINNASAAVTGYATTRAQEQQKTAYALQGNMASLSLSVLKIVVEVMFYAIFPIIVIIAILPGGVAVLKKYVIALFWIQSWAPLYSVLNMLVNIYGRSKSMAAIAGTSAYGISAATMPGLAEGNEWVAAVAGYTMMSVPFLSYGLIHYGAGAFSQLSTHFGSVTQSAASHAAEEATTGNYNMGNTSFDNHSRHSISGFKQDQNLSVATGRSSVQMANGAWASTTLDGSKIIDMGSALSKTGANINYAENLSQSLSEAADQSQRAGMQHSTSAQENLTNAITEGMNFSKNRSNGISSDSSNSHGEVYTDNKAFSQIIDLAQNYARQHNVTDSIAAGEVARAALTARASVDAGVGFPGFKVNGSVGIEGSRASTNSSSRSKGEVESKSDTISERDNLASLLSNTFNDVTDARYNQNHSSGSAYSESINASLSKAQSHMTSASASYSEEQQYRESAQRVSSNSAGFNQDLSQQYMNHLLHNTEAGRRSGISGANAIMNNPELNQQHLSGFLKEKTKAMHLNLGSKEDNIGNIQKTYNSNANELNNNNLLKENHQSNTSHLNNLKGSAKLNLPVKNNIGSHHAEQRDQLSSNIETRRQEIKSEKDINTKNFDENHKKPLY